MSKKLIFIRNGKEDLDQLYIRTVDDEVVNPDLGIGYYLYDIDRDIKHKGFKKTWQDGVIASQLNEWYVTSYPCVLDWKQLWFNTEKDKYEIYFIENGKLVNIHDINSFRRAQVIEKLYLSNWFGEQ